VPFRGPWMLHEVLAEEFRELGLQVTAADNRRWWIRPADVRNEQRLEAHLVELQFYGELAGLIAEQRANASRVARLSDAWQRAFDQEQARMENDLRAEGALTTLGVALRLPSEDLVRLCRALLETERGRALADNVPDVAALTAAERWSTRLRFNRVVLEIAFHGLLKSVDDRELERLFGELSAAEQARGDEDKQFRWALCLSGGGIRSASFSLGVLQGLAENGLLDRFDYLSTVSGGGYIGAWLSAWIARQQRQAVLANLAATTDEPLEPEVAPVRHLRLYSRYLSPHRGVLTPDMWTLITTVLRNLLLNWTVILPFVAALLVVPFFAAAVAAHGPTSSLGVNTESFVLFVLGFSGIATGVWFVHSRRPGSGAQTIGALSFQRRRASERAFLLYCLLPLAIGIASLNTLLYWILTEPALQGEFPFLTSSSVSLLGWTIPISGRLMTLAVFGALAHMAGWTIARPARKPGAPIDWSILGDLAAIAASGLVAGAFAYFIAEWIRGFAANRPDILAKIFSTYPHAIGGTASDVLYSILAFPGFFAALVGATFVYIGLSPGNRSEPEREWSARFNAWLLIAAITWLGVASIAALSGWVTENLSRWIMALIGTGFGGATALIGHSSASAATRDKAQKQASASSSTSSTFARLALPLMVPLAVVLLLMMLATWDLAAIGAAVGAFEAHALWATAAVAVVLAAVSLAASRVVNVNRFSLHAMYRSRLVRAYLGASREAGSRSPDPFTGFDPRDDLPIADTRDPGGAARPIHLVNIALNLTGGSQLGIQDRAARSFSVSRLFAGAGTLGYRRTASADADARYAGDDGVMLGTAMAISGAAASPNMGYHSSKAVTFLMTIFNARLGWWLGNPGWPGSRVYHVDNPPSRFSPIFAELLSDTRDSDPLVYLSDGGHFENLGLYEMILRRCRVIVVVDASCDADYRFDDLGNAIRKARIDFGVPITFDDVRRIRPRRPDGGFPEDAGHFATARIGYSAVDRHANDGLLVYIKPTMTGDEPADVLAYSRGSQAFPHESTAEQFFSEQQLESYRALGLHSVADLFRGPPAIVDGLIMPVGPRLGGHRNNGTPVI
jgi:hypothetical protein